MARRICGDEERMKWGEDDCGQLVMSNGGVHDWQMLLNVLF
jgi:hypothetical protein